MKKALFIACIILAFILRFYSLGKFPLALDWDEAALGYNAYSILKTGRDEYGYFLPIQFRSFGDYKPPLYVYLLAPIVKIFGLTESAVRFPSVLVGFLTIIISFILFKRLFPNIGHTFLLLFFFLFAISPWHIQFSRVAFEANVGLFWFILGAYFLVNFKSNRFYIMLSAIAFTASIYTYHSLRLVAPVFALGLGLIMKEELLRYKKNAVFALLLSFLLLIPVVININQGVSTRFLSVSSLTPDSLNQSINKIEYDLQRNDMVGKLVHNSRIIYFISVLKGYLDHWDLSFLFLTGDFSGRHHVPDMGMLYLIELPFVLIGIYELLFGNNSKRSKLIIFFWFLIAPLASSLTQATPHAVRSMLYLPTFQIFSAFGVIKLFNLLKNNKLLIISKYILIFVYIVSIYYYLDMYYVHSNYEQAQEWQYGYKEMIREVNMLESQYDKIIVTYSFDQPYIYFLFYNKIDPSWYQLNWGGGQVLRDERKFAKYTFRKINWQEDKDIKNALIIGTIKEIPDWAPIIKEIRYPNNEIVYRIVSLP